MPIHYATLALDWASIFAADLARYLIGAGGVALVLLLARGPLGARRIQKRRPTGADRMRELGLSIGTVAVFATNGLGILLLARAGIVTVHPGFPGLAIGAAELVAIIVAHDAWFYWTHRALHDRRLFRAAHLAHHRSRTPTPWAAYAFAHTEAVIQALFLPLFLLCLPMHGISLFLFLAHMILRNALGHSGHELMPPGFTRHWLGRWFTTTVHHDIHHSEGRHNFGLYFTWWDRLGGTEHPDYHRRFEAVARPWRLRGSRSAQILTVLLLAILTIGPARAEAVEGLWLTEDMDAVIEIESDPQTLSGRIRWLRAPEDSAVAVGRQMFRHFSAGSDRWAGRLVDHRNGAILRATLRAKGANWLEVRGCRGPICRTWMWRRLSNLPRRREDRAAMAG